MRLLVVDDDRELCSMFRAFFEREGFAPEFENDGRAGLTRALTEAFDLVLLDVMLPSIDGFEVLRQLRERSDVPVLMLTAKGEQCERVRGLRSGADDYLTKPFDPEELLARVRAILRRVAAVPKSAPEVLEVGDLRLLPGARDAYFRGKNLGLTAMECEILEQLMRCCGRVVSRDQMYLQLYNRTASPLDRSVDTHVSRIRRKLGGGQGLILSIRGAGYQLRYGADSES